MRLLGAMGRRFWMGGWIEFHLSLSMVDESNRTIKDSKSETPLSNPYLDFGSSKGQRICQ